MPELLAERAAASLPAALPQRACLRFHGGLQALVYRDRRRECIAHEFWVAPAVKDAIESCGVPHTEIGLLHINGVAAAPAALLRGGDTVDVYPPADIPAAGAPAVDAAGTSAVAAGIPAGDAPALAVAARGASTQLPPCFAVDVNLGRLATLLRLLGFDTLYRNDFDDAGLAALAVAQGRILLTRDRGLLMRREIVQGAFVRETKPEAQLLATLRRFGLARQLRPFSRCLRCNGELRPVNREDVAPELPPRVRASGDLLFSRCIGCGRLYWPGTHYRRLQATVLALQAALA
jgi:uncharacterized protein with PIN domain